MSYLSDQSTGKNASILNFLITIILTILFLVYFSVVAYTKDLLWFYPVFNAQPSRAVIWCYGREVILGQDSLHLAAIAKLVNEQISGDKRWDALNLTDQTYHYYQTDTSIMVLELFYNEPQRIHSRSPFFSGFTSLLIPLDARFSNDNIFFSLINGKPSGGSFHVETFKPVRSYIHDNDLCIKP